MAKEDAVDPRMMSVQPRLRYNTVGGINGPLVILDNVRTMIMRIPETCYMFKDANETRSNSQDTTRLCL